MTVFQLQDIGRLASDDDNCAIATKIIEANTAVYFKKQQFKTSHQILEGHRFAIQPIQKGDLLTSWGFPFGKAISNIVAGEYICNTAMLQELSSRKLPFELPSNPNFSDDIPPFEFNEAELKTAVYPTQKLPTATFLGYKRPGNRGVGTRNSIALLSTTTITSGFAHFLEKQAAISIKQSEHIDDIVAITHTEGNSAEANNDEIFLRTMAGYIVHPNVGAVLIIDDGQGNNGRLKNYLEENRYAIIDVHYSFLSVNGNFSAKLEEALRIIQEWVDILGQQQRTPQPLSELKIALQCGGSDSFSGISGNPLASWLAKETIAQGGSANLAETDELVGAESYVLDNIKDGETAVTFLKTVERFKQWAKRHGHSVKGNPSGGNLYRGLYNIFLKSLGAATKRHPQVPLDFVIDYSQPMTMPGFYFMDSPGNDLESIAGQVGAGCNLIFFVTGNGSITNFPFVPTIKIVTTSKRFNMLESDMDIDAGTYLNGRSMDDLGEESFQKLLRIISGEKSAGEQAGHAQVQIWRDWPLKNHQTSDSRTKDVEERPFSIPTLSQEAILPEFKHLQNKTHHLNLIMPTSLCSGQIAQMCAQRINPEQAGKTVALSHTEGCGASAVPEFTDIVLGYVTHPHIKNCMMVEHGCEKTHNAYWRNQWLDADLDPDAFGWASIQLDGGIEPVIHKMQSWLIEQNQKSKSNHPKKSNIPIRVGILSEGAIDDETAVFSAKLTQQLLAINGQVIFCSGDNLLEHNLFQTQLQIDKTAPNLHFAKQPKTSGFFIMDNPSSNWVETITGLGATGVDLMIGLVKRPLPSHPFLPVLQSHTPLGQLDFEPNSSEENLFNFGRLIQQAIDGTYTTVANRQENIAFQVTRGRLGISL